MIKHFPITNIDKVIKHYTEKDGVPIQYVCTTEFNSSFVADIFYRDTIHPQFGNHYFAITYDGYDDTYSIFNADSIEELTFGMVEDDEGNLQYSMYQHDYKSFNNGNMIDGGRSYIRYSGTAEFYKVKDGEMIHESGI